MQGVGKRFNPGFFGEVARKVLDRLPLPNDNPFINQFFSVLMGDRRRQGDRFDFVVDRNVHKQGLLMPGVHIPIRAPEALLEEQPDYLLLLAWNFKDEIVAQQREYAERGGRFIVPVPEPVIL